MMGGGGLCCGGSEHTPSGCGRDMYSTTTRERKGGNRQLQVPPWLGLKQDGLREQKVVEVQSAGSPSITLARVFFWQLYYSILEFVQYNGRWGHPGFVSINSSWGEEKELENKIEDMRKAVKGHESPRIRIYIYIYI